MNKSHQTTAKPVKVIGFIELPPEKKKPRTSPLLPEIDENEEEFYYALNLEYCQRTGIDPAHISNHEKFKDQGIRILYRRTI